MKRHIKALELRLADRLHLSHLSDEPTQAIRKNARWLELLSTLTSTLAAVTVAFSTFEAESRVGLKGNLLLGAGIVTASVLFVIILSSLIRLRESSEITKLKKELIDAYSSALIRSSLNPSSLSR